MEFRRIKNRSMSWIFKCWNKPVNTPDLVLPAIYRLNVDLVHDICDLLSLRELCMLAGTCKAMKSCVGEYFNVNYSASDIECSLGMLFGCNLDRGIANVFYPFLTQVLVQNDECTEKRFDYLASHTKSLKEITFKNVSITNFEMQRIQNILKTIESVRFIQPGMKCDFYHDFLVHCENLRSLIFGSAFHIIAGLNNQWMLRSYPTLTYLEITQIDAKQMIELPTFLQNNPQLKTLALNSTLVRKNYDTLMESNLELDDFAIIINAMICTDFKTFCKKLNDLYEKGFYKRIHLYLFDIAKIGILQTIDLGGFVKLHTERTYFDESILPALQRIQELSMAKCSNLGDAQSIEYFARNLRNIERLYFFNATYDDLRTFVRFLPNLKKIKVRDLVMDDSKVIDLAAMNDDRANCLGAKRTDVFVKQEWFSATKAAMHTVHFPNVTLRLLESHDWNHHFLYSKIKEYI